MTRRSEEERVKIFNRWSHEEKTWLDYLDGAVADLLVENEDGRLSLKEIMTDEEHKLYWKWDRRSKDPAYQRMREVIVERVKRRTAKWYSPVCPSGGGVPLSLCHVFKPTWWW